MFTAVVFAQNKNAKASMEVDGVCDMCKERIEKAAIRTKGVKSAVWNVDTHELKLIYDERKTDLKTISKNYKIKMSRICFILISCGLLSVIYDLNNLSLFS